MIHHGDCIEVMAGMESASIDAIVTDPPYSLSFMGRAWDTDFGHDEWCAEAFRVAKPGAHLLAFSGTRTDHHLKTALEKAGWEIRDTLVWAYASGFPKSLDVSKAIDKQRDDGADARRVSEFLAEARRRSGKTLAEVEKAVGMAHNSLCDLVQPAKAGARRTVPTIQRWERLKAVIGFDDSMDAEVWRLNGRKGTAGEAWQNAKVIGVKKGAMNNWKMDGGTTFVDREQKVPATDLAKQWQGWGTALKPAWEPIVMARKPLVGSVARNVTEYGTGALNIDGTRIDSGGESRHMYGNPGMKGGRFGAGEYESGTYTTHATTTAGRWPANVILTDPIFDGGVDGVVGGGESGPGAVPARTNGTGFEGGADPKGSRWHGAEYEPRQTDSGTYSRFFLIPKADRADREPVLRGQLAPQDDDVDGSFGLDAARPHTKPDYQYQRKPRANSHPTVKPTELMRHLVRLVTPPGGTVLDPFLGSGTTAIACEMEGFEWIGIEKEAEYVAIAEARLNGVQRGLGLDVPAPTRKRTTTGQQGPTPDTNGQSRWTEWREGSEVA